MSVLISAWKRFWVVSATIHFVEVVALSMRCVFIYAYWCPTAFLYQMMFILFNSYADCTTSGTGSTDPSGTSEFTTGFCFCSVRVAQSLFVGVVIWDHCFVIVSSVCLSPKYSFMLPVSYLQSFLSCYFKFNSYIVLIGWELWLS
jgi:hypothetical protein